MTPRFFYCIGISLSYKIKSPGNWCLPDKNNTDMNYSVSNFVGFVNRHAYPILFILFALWMCIGIFPLVCYESDSQEVILGCDLLYYNGWQFPPTYCYEYRMQPLTVITIVALRHLLSFLTCEQIYCLLSAISSFVFLIGSVEFARNITQQSRAKILIAAMFLPEMYAIAMYPNSAIPAAACFIWALYGIIKNRHWAAILLMCIAPLFRVDVVIVYPVILPLLIFQGKTWKKAFVISSIYCIIIVAVGLLLFRLCRADVLSAFSGYEEWNEKIGFISILIAIFGFYSIIYFILLPIGIVRMLREKLWKEMFLVLLPIILLHFVYRSMGCAAKHYLYIAPFVIIAGVRALIWFYNVGQREIWLKRLCSVSLILIFTLSVRITPPNRPWVNNDKAYTGTIIIPFSSISISSYTISFGIGAGQFTPTHDEKMLASGLLFYSWHIHSYKNELKISQKKLKETIDSLPTSEIVYPGWGSYVPILSEYFRKDNPIKYHHDNKYFTIENAERYLTMRYEGINYENEDCFENELKKYCSSLHKENIYIVADGFRHQSYLDTMAKNRSVKKVAEMVYKFDNTGLR